LSRAPGLHLSKTQFKDVGGSGPSMAMVAMAHSKTWLNRRSQDGLQN
jgi:hypothetical protein